MTPVAWDIETTPRLDAEGTSLFARTEAKDSPRTPTAFHPMLIRIVSVAMAYRTPAGNINYWSRTARTEEDEEALLTELWEKLSTMHRFLMVGFNSKRFDTPVLAARSALHQIQPTHAGILNTYPFKFSPHCDLLGWLPQGYKLHDLCQFLGVDSPKHGGPNTGPMDGAGVAALLEAGDMEAIEAYNRADVRATLECYERIKPYLK